MGCTIEPWMLNQFQKNVISFALLQVCITDIPVQRTNMDNSSLPDDYYLTKSEYLKLIIMEGAELHAPNIHKL